MPRIVYKPKVKAAIFAAVRKALGSGKSWTAAHEAAKALKYTSELRSLQKMYYKRRKPGRKPAAQATKAKAAAQAGGKLTGALRYDAATKAAIVRAAVAARKAGKTWPQALEVARAVGFRAKVPRLIRFVQSASKPAKKPRRQATLRARAPRIVALARGRDLKVLESTLSRIVKERVRAVLDDAIAVLQRARDQA